MIHLEAMRARISKHCESASILCGSRWNSMAGAFGSKAKRAPAAASNLHCPSNLPILRSLPTPAPRKPLTSSRRMMPRPRASQPRWSKTNPANRALFEIMLKPHYRVVTYGTGPEVLEAFTRERPDVVIMDITLPGMSGLEVLKRLRADSVLKSIPVVAVSAHAMSGDREKFLLAGFNEYLAKPIAGRAALLDALRPLVAAKSNT